MAEREAAGWRGGLVPSRQLPAPARVPAATVLYPSSGGSFQFLIYTFLNSQNQPHSSASEMLAPASQLSFRKGLSLTVTESLLQASRS